MNIDVRNLLKGEILSKEGTVNSDVILNHRVVALYFSAHWCPPCREFTPVLSAFYQDLKNMGTDIEIVFCSADNDETSFKQYYSEMPWCAIPFADNRIKQLNETAGIQGIPTLFFIDSLTGKILHEGQDGRDIVYESNINLVLDWTM